MTTRTRPRRILTGRELADIAEALDRAGLTIDPAAYNNATDPDSHCDDCGTETWPAEYYWVNNETWQAAGADNDAFLCIGCLETRLGRQLHRGDFTEAPVTNSALLRYSDRLRDRLTRQPPAVPVRYAGEYGTCGATGCVVPVRPGQKIVKPPGRAWRHLTCDDPGGRRKRS